MTLAVAMLLFGALLTYAGVRNYNVGALLRGEQVKNG